MRAPTSSASARRAERRGQRIVVVGASAGGLAALGTLLATMPRGLAAPVAIVQHLGQADDAGNWARLLSARCALPVQEARDREPIAPGVVYLAPAGYHLLVERNRRFALSADAKWLHVRPSIDALFQSAADVYRGGCVGVILTGANDDGARGLADIRSRGGYAIVQDPDGAQAPQMPRAALEMAGADAVLPLQRIAAEIEAQVRA